jgi:hypothetical protein
MSTENNQLGNKFIRNWVLANGIGWLVGFIIAFPLSYGVVNIFYPKETNLILGLCIGAAVGYAQWLVLKRKFKISSSWGHICTICLGIPFIAEFILNELGYEIDYFRGNYEYLGGLVFGIAVGLVMGVLQMRLLKPYFKNAPRWIVASSVGWGICWFAVRLELPFFLGILLGGVLLGLITGYSIILMSLSTN